MHVLHAPNEQAQKPEVRGPSMTNSTPAAVFKGALNPEIHASLYERKYTLLAIDYKDIIQLGPTGQKGMYSSGPISLWAAILHTSCILSSSILSVAKGPSEAVTCKLEVMTS